MKYGKPRLRGVKPKDLPARWWQIVLIKRKIYRRRKDLVYDISDKKWVYWRGDSYENNKK